MANDDHLKLLKQAETWNEWRHANPGIKPDLGRANLSGMDLKNAKLYGANLSNADLNRADLSGANLRRAMLSGANLRETDLSAADFGEATLIAANLSHANLGKTIFFSADLRQAILRGANLDQTDLSYSRMAQTELGNLDLSKAEKLETVRHLGPSTVGVDTIYVSNGKIPEVFLRGAGVSEDFIAFMHSLTGRASEFYSCFISYSIKDQEFASRLYIDLQAKGVRCWYFPEDAKWGEPVWGEINRSINVYDKLVVVCSANSLRSGPVNREIERALQREDRENRHILFPIRLDDYLFAKWENHRKADVISKVVGNFCGWEHPQMYRKSFDQLVKNLKGEKNQRDDHAMTD